MAGRGLQHIPLRIPSQWDAAWYERHIREVLALADTRNAIAGSGIEITGQPGEPATIQSSEDIQNLLLQPFLLASPSGFLEQERTLAADGGLQLVDDGANSTMTVRIADQGVTLVKLTPLAACTVIGNPLATGGNVDQIFATNDGDVLTRQGTTLGFTNAPVWTGPHRWGDNIPVELGDNGELSVYFDGLLSQIVSTEPLKVTAYAFEVEVDSADTYEIDETGAVLVNGDPGDAGDVLTSAGAGAPVVWAPASGGSGGGNVTPDTHPASPDAMDDEFEGAFDTGLWTWRNQGSATATTVQGSLVITAPAGAGDNLRVVEQTISAAGRWRAKCARGSIGGNNLAGMGFVHSGSGRLITVSSYGTGRIVIRSNSVTSGASAPYATDDALLYGFRQNWVYFEIEYDGANVAYRISPTGVDGSFQTLFSEAAASFLGTPDRVCIFANSNDASIDGVALFDWFRRMA